MKREIIRIDEEKCDGCGLCVPNCHEGALQIIDEKAVLVSELMCDGLGACIGHCPQDALTIEEREAEPYDELAVMKEMVLKGENVVIAHLKHLKDHNEHDFLKQGVSYLMGNKESLEFSAEEVIKEVHNYSGKGSPHNAPRGLMVAGVGLEGLQVPAGEPVIDMAGGTENLACGCPGSAERSFGPTSKQQGIHAGGPAGGSAGIQGSELSHWPVQLHLVNPGAGHFQGTDLLVAADCVAYAMGSFHSDYLRGKSLVIACPKLDSNMEVYQQKLTAMIDHSRVNTITVMIMEVPCCGGLIQLVRSAVSGAERKVPVKLILVGVQGDVLDEKWV